MGYDMYIEQKVEAEQMAKAEAQQRFEQAVAKRDALPQGSPERDRLQEEEVMPLYDEMGEADKRYFRLNIWGMGKARDLMHQYGMLAPDFEVTWPSADDFDLSEEEADDYWDDEEHDVTKMSPSLLAFHEAQTRARDGEGEGLGIPVHKLCSNDGWLVTERECASAVSQYRNARAWKQREEPDWWGDWIAYLERASTRGGFRVY